LDDNEIDGIIDLIVPSGAVRYLWGDWDLSNDAAVIRPLNH
jgi:hypothetical protein